MHFLSLAGLLAVASWCTVLARPLFPRGTTPTIFHFAEGYYTYPQYAAQRQAIVQKYVQRALDDVRVAGTPFRDPFVVHIKGAAHASPSDSVLHITFYLTDPDVCGAVECTGHAYVFADPDPKLVKGGDAAALAQSKLVERYKGVIFSGSKRIWGVRVLLSDTSGRRADECWMQTKAPPELAKAKMGADVIALQVRIDYVGLSC